MKISIIKGNNLSKNYIDLINKHRKREFGANETKDFKKQEPNSLFFFLKDKENIMAFGMLKPVTLNYLGIKYKILGLGSGVAIIKGRGYGKKLMLSRINYLKKKGKTGLGFCLRKNLGFFKKCGLKTEKNFIKRFRYKNPRTGKLEIDHVGDGLYCEGKDKLISKILLTKSIAYTNVPFW